MQLTKPVQKNKLTLTLPPFLRAISDTMQEAKPADSAEVIKLKGRIREAFDLFDKERRGTVIQEYVCVAAVAKHKSER